MRIDEAIDHLEEKINDKDYKWPCEECRHEHEQLLGWLKELKGLRLENEVILRRLKHLLESDYISQFDQVDPNTKEYIRNIKEAGKSVSYRRVASEKQEGRRMSNRVAYLCDGKKCPPEKASCQHEGPCRHTSDIEHAMNFRRFHDTDDYYEVENVMRIDGQENNQEDNNEHMDL